MITYYQELLNECIDIQEHKKILKLLRKMKEEVSKNVFKNNNEITERK